MSDNFFKKHKGKEPVDEQLFEKARAILIEQLEVAPDKVTLGSRIVEDLGADSLDTVELIMALEDAFNMEISDEDAEKLLTVREVVEYLQKRVANKQEQKDRTQ